MNNRYVPQNGSGGMGAGVPQYYANAMANAVPGGSGQGNNGLSMAGAIGGAAGALGSGLYNLFGGATNPADSAMKYFDQIPGKVAPYFNPYIQAGQGALSNLQGQYNNLVKDPNAVLNQMGKGYQASPGYQWQLNQALQGGNQAAAAGGMLGSPANQQWAQQTSQGLANQDYYNYLGKALGLYGTGLSGLEGINNTGYNASTNMANSWANTLAQQGNLSYAGQANQNQQQGGGFGAALGGLGSLASLFGLF